MFFARCSILQKPWNLSPKCRKHDCSHENLNHFQWLFFRLCFYQSFNQMHAFHKKKKTQPRSVEYERKQCFNFHQNHNLSKSTSISIFPSWHSSFPFLLFFFFCFIFFPLLVENKFEYAIQCYKIWNNVVSLESLMQDKLNAKRQRKKEEETKWAIFTTALSFNLIHLHV